MKPLHLILFCLLFVISTVQAADIRLNVSANPVVLGDQITLSFTSNGQPNGDPDFSVLEPHFDLRGQSQSHSIRMINGRTTQQIVWSVKAYPKQSGKITIPAVAFGSDKSNSAELNVLSSAAQLPNANGSAATASPDVLVEAFVEPASVYVQQQIIYVQRLYYSVNFSQNATLSTPQLKTGKMDIEQLEDNRRFTEKRNGRNYQVIERRFAVFPVQSGKIEFAPTFFEGRLLGNSNTLYDPFGFGTGKTIRRYSPAVTVDVKPQNAGFSGSDWIPAKSIKLNQSWSVAPDKLKTGEPVTITIDMIAEGLRAEQLPDFELQLPQHIKSYSDRASLKNDKTAAGVIGKRQEKIVLVPSRSGSFDLSEMKLVWWNTETDQQATTTLVFDPLMIKGENTAAAESPESSYRSAEPVTTEIAPSTTAPQKASNPDSSMINQFLKGLDNDFWFYFSMLLILLQVFTLFLLWKQSNSSVTNQKALTPEGNVKSVKRTQIEKTLRHVCTQNKPKLLHNVILEWGRVSLGVRQKSLKAIAAHLPPELAKEMEAFDQSLYAQNGNAFDCSKLCQGLLRFEPENNEIKPVTRKQLALYPED